VVPFGGADSSFLAPPLHHINRKKKEGHTLLRRCVRMARPSEAPSMSGI
jgi:hypothetical protein